MKDVEKKKKEEFSVWSNGRKLFSRRNSRQGMPLTVATREVGSKGSLMDRIRSLEDRLLQVMPSVLNLDIYLPINHLHLNFTSTQNTT